MTFVIQKNAAGKWEWIAMVGPTVYDRSGFIFKSYNAAFRSFQKYPVEVG